MNRLKAALPISLALAVALALIGVVAAPTGAQSVNSVLVGPNKAGELAMYTVNITTTKVLHAGDTIALGFPDGTTIPSTISRSFVSINGYTLTSDDPQPIVDVAAAKIIIQVPPLTAPLGPKTFSVVISQGASLKNPAIAKETSDTLPYELRVTTTGVGGEDLGKLAYRIVPSYKISPTQGGRSTTVTVTGKGWTPNGSVAVGGSMVPTVGTVLADGTFSVCCNPITSGVVTVTDSKGRSEATWGIAAATFALTPRITVLPTSGNVGSRITISGFDFTHDGIIDPNLIGSLGHVLIGGIMLMPTTGFPILLVTRDGYGAHDDFEADFILPYNLKGTQTIEVADNTGKRATTSFTINLPYVVFSPVSAAPNAVATMTGYHFASVDRINAGMIRIGSPAMGWNTVRVDVDSAGYWTVNLKVPASAAVGDNPVSVTTQNGTSLQTVFTVAARTLSLTPNSGPFGTTVVLGGTNMTQGGQIPVGGLTFDSSPWNDFAINIDSQGNIVPPSQTLKVTTFLTGTYGPKTVEATDNCGGVPGCTPATAKAVFTLTQPTITVNPTAGYMGGTLTVTGAGWVPGAGGVVQVMLDSDTKLVTTPDGDGNFAAQFTVPGLLQAESTHLISAMDFNGNAAAAQTFMLCPVTLAVSPQSGPAGTTVTVTGIGFTPQAAITNFGWDISQMGDPPAAPPGTPPTEVTGGFTLTTVVPALAPGGRVIGVKTQADPTATVAFIVTQSPPTVQEALNSLIQEGALVRVWDYAGGQWWHYDPTDPAGSNLAGVAEGRVYWVKVSSDCTLVYGGRAWNLAAGWNLVGWTRGGPTVLGPVSRGVAALEAPDSPPGLPCRFHGIAQLDGADVPDGTVVAAVVDGDIYTTVTPSAYGHSTYLLQIEPPQGVSYQEGSAVDFTIAGRPGQPTAIWTPGANVEVNLSAGTRPTPPCRFYGSVQTGGLPVPDGTTIRAVVEGDVHTTATPSEYGASTYCLTIVPPAGESYGDDATVYFTKIGDYVAHQTATWEAGGNTELNLSAGTGETLVYISPSDQRVCQSDVFTVNVGVDPEVAIASAQFDLSFDPSLLSAHNVAEGNLFGQNGASASFDPGTIDNVAGTVTNVHGAILQQGGSVSASGTLAVVSFTAKTADGTSPLHLSDVVVGDAGGQPVEIVVSNGVVSVRTCPDWDVNGDVCISVLDIILVGQRFAQTGSQGWTREDVNNDGTIDVLDIILIGQHFGEGCST